MEAIILAGGFGTRLKNVISDIPKPMAPINGMPFLSLILKQLERNGIKKVVLAVGYQHEKISNYFGNYYCGLSIEYSIEDEPLGTGGCVKKAIQKTTDQYVFVINGDTFFDIQFSHLQKPKNILIACKKMSDTSRYGQIQIKNDIVVKFSEKGISTSGYINGGIYYLNRNVFDKFLLDEKFSLEKDFFEIFTDQLSIETYLSDEYFIDIGIPEDYNRAQRELK